jgi:hypothetical protein
MAAKDDEIKAVVSELDGLLERLNVNVTALAAILTAPALPEGEPA